ncbi:MAG: helix-turn-helix domain-containing protein [Gemmatimonadota bacterium]
MVKANGPTGRAADRDTEQRIIEAAHAVFIRRGTAGARTQDIAEEAGVNKALIHYYFRSKERLAEVVFQRAGLRLLPPLFAILGSDAELEEKVERAIEHYLTGLLEAPYLPGYLLSEMNHHPERLPRLVEGVTGAPAAGFANRVLAGLAAQIHERVESGAMRPITAEQFVMNLVSLCLFPFAARPLFTLAFDWSGDDFHACIAERRRDLSGFFMAGLRP